LQLEQLAHERAPILQQLSEGVIIAGTDGRLVFVNEAAEALHGVKKLDVAPDAYADSYSLFTMDGEPYPSEALPLARAVVAAETVVDARWRIRRPDGSEVVAIGSARPLMADGRQIGSILTVRDDSERFEAERLLRASEERYQLALNAASAIGGSALAVKTVESYLGTQVNHLVEVSFENFPDLIDALGGVDYTGGCVVSKINGGFKNGGFTLRLKRGTSRLNGKQALALARTRTNLCNKREDDRTRARRQQKLFAAMKGRLVSPGAFIRAPLISWNAPKALRSDMSGPTLLGLFGALATSGSPAPRILKPSSDVTLPDGGRGLVVSEGEKRREVRRFLRG